MRDFHQRRCENHTIHRSLSPWATCLLVSLLILSRFSATPVYGQAGIDEATFARSVQQARFVIIQALDYLPLCEKDYWSGALIAQAATLELKRQSESFDALDSLRPGSLDLHTNEGPEKSIPGGEKLSVVLAEHQERLRRTFSSDQLNDLFLIKGEGFSSVVKEIGDAHDEAYSEVVGAVAVVLVLASDNNATWNLTTADLGKIVKELESKPQLSSDKLREMLDQMKNALGKHSQKVDVLVERLTKESKKLRFGL